MRMIQPNAKSLISLLFVYLIKEDLTLTCVLDKKILVWKLTRIKETEFSMETKFNLIFGDCSMRTGMELND